MTLITAAANANIREQGITVGRELLLCEVEQACRNLLKALRIDTVNDPNVRETPQRMAKMFVDELFRGRYEPIPELRQFPDQCHMDQLYTVGPVPITSMCSHHMLPFTGHCFIGILPNPGMPLLGLSKFARLADWIFCRPQIQEEATIQLADLIMTKCSPLGLGLVVQAEHQCMTLRGVKKPGTKMTTSVMRGALLENAKLREEFLTLANHAAQ